MENFFEAGGNYMRPENITGVKKDKGDVLFADIRKDMKKYHFVIGRGLEGTINEEIRNVTSFKEEDHEKYERFSQLAENFPGIWRKHEMKVLEKITNKKFTENIDRLKIINQLIELNKFNLAPELWKSIEKHTKEGKLPTIGGMESILKNSTKDDYRVIDRGLKIYGWGDIAIMMDFKGVRYQTITDDKKFAQIEKSIENIEKEYGRKLKFEDAKTNLLLLSEPEYAKKILFLKNQVNELEAKYKIDRIDHIDEFEKIEGIRQTGELKEILSGKFRAKMDLIKEVYELEKFGSVDILQNWKDLPEEEFEKISSSMFGKKVGDLGEKIGRSKGDIIQFFASEKFKDIDHPIVEALLEGKVILSPDVREEKPDMIEILGSFPKVLPPDPSLWGRIRQGWIRNTIDFATFGRPGLECPPFFGWEFLAAARGITKDDLKRQINNSNLLILAEGSGKEPGLEKAKERLDFVRDNLPPMLKARFNKIFETLDEWGKEGARIEEKNSEVFLGTGAYVKIDNDPRDLEASRKSSIDERGCYGEIYSCLDKSFKSPSWMSLMLGNGVEMLYELLDKRKDDFIKQLRNLEYLNNQRQNLSLEEIRILELKSADILNAFGIMESVYNTPKGVYFSNPPLHGGERGEEPRAWTSRSYALRDRAFRKIEEDGKVIYVNNKEYYLSKQVNPLDQLKIQLISFSDKPDPKNLADKGFSVRLERNGKTRFLDKKEVEDFIKALKEYTLPTLFLENSPLLGVGEKAV